MNTYENLSQYILEGNTTQGLLPKDKLKLTPIQFNF